MTNDLLIRGGRLGHRGRPADIVVSGDRVVAVASVGTVDALGVDILDASGCTVLPGIADAHVHVDQWVHRDHRIDLAAATSAAHAVKLLLDADDPSGRVGPAVLTGHGFVDGLWPDVPRRALLDAAFHHRPVAAISADLHTIWLNGPALTLVGADGHPTGILREEECLKAVAQLAAVESADVIDRWTLEALDHITAQGVTALTDFEFADNVANWSRRGSRRRLPIRVSAAVWRPWLPDAIEVGLGTGDSLPGTGGLAVAGPFKIMSDGSLNTRTAYCHDPYPQGTRGLQMVDGEELVDMIDHARANGWEPAVHAIGDAANSAALDAFEKVGGGGRIEHAQLIRRRDIERFAAARVTASIQPQHVVADRDVADRYWPDRTDRAFPFGSLLAAGATLLIGSDAPVSPVAPWQAIADAVLRTDDDRPPWHHEQSLPLSAAIIAACGGRNTITVGQVADLTIAIGDLDDPSVVAQTTVAATIVDGRVVLRT